MKFQKVFIYWKYFGKTLNRHDGPNNMPGWFQKLFKSGKTSSTQKEKGKESEKPAGGASFESESSSSLKQTVTKEQQLKGTLGSELRWKRKYDVFVCHSYAQRDIEEAGRLVSFLETASGVSCGTETPAQEVLYPLSFARRWRIATFGLCSSPPALCRTIGAVT